MKTDEVLWVEKYRPTTIAECVLPPRLKDLFTKIVQSQELPNMIFAGRPGTGKTTVVHALANELDCSYLFIPASDESGIDTLRVKVTNFVSTMSLDGRRKMVAYDEGDYLNATSTQPALRSFIDMFSECCSFIFTCNFPSRIIEPLQSRCPIIDFNFTKEETKELLIDAVKAIIKILETEKIEYDKKTLALFVKDQFPDLRKTIGLLSLYAKRKGIIDPGILRFTGDDQFDSLVPCFKDRDYDGMCSWVSENCVEDPKILYSKLWRFFSGILKDDSIPRMIQIMAEKQYWAAFVGDHELNLRACLQEIMADCEVK